VAHATPGITQQNESIDLLAHRSCYMLSNAKNTAKGVRNFFSNRSDSGRLRIEGFSVGGEPTARGGARINASRVGAESGSDPAAKKLEPIRFDQSSEGIWAVGVWQRH
jgi:hypothetical protein